MSKSLTLTFTGFAHDLGAHTRLTRDVSLVWHREYVKADDVTRAARREEFILHFLIGYGMSAAKAAKVMSQSRDERKADDHNAYSAARMKFTYHIVRDAQERSHKAAVSPVEALLAKYNKLTAAQQRAFLKAVSA